MDAGGGVSVFGRGVAPADEELPPTSAFRVGGITGKISAPRIGRNIGGAASDASSRTNLGNRLRLPLLKYLIIGGSCFEAITMGMTYLCFHS